MNSYQQKGFNMASPGLPDGQKIGDVLADVTAKSPSQAKFTVGAETSNAIIVTTQLRDLNGAPLTGRHSVNWWLSDAPGGAATATAPATSTVVSTGTAVNVFAAKVSGQSLTDNTGTLALTITETGAKDWYLNIASGGLVATSPKISFSS